MNKLLAIYLVFFKGYSVIRFDDQWASDAYSNGFEYGACNVGLGYDYGHDGVWGQGHTPTEAVLHAHKLTKQ